LKTNIAWYEFWLPILSGLGQQCCHPCIDIRHEALVLLQRLFLSEKLASAADLLDPSSRFDCFDIVIFPLIDDLSKYDQTVDRIGSGETNVRASSLLTKVFLCFSNVLKNEKDFSKLWINVLEHLILLANLAIVNDNQIVLEGIQESLKNMILVLVSDKVLEKGNVIWAITWEKVNTIYPGFEKEMEEPRINEKAALVACEIAVNSPEVMQTE
jgi:hypothetical protein